MTTLGQLAALPVEVVTRRIGERNGRALWERAQGIDESPVTVPGRPKSVSREETFDRDITDAVSLDRHLVSLAADVARRLREGGWQARTVTLKLRFSDFTTLQRQCSLPSPLDAERPLADAARRLLREAWAGVPVRLLGVGVSALDEAVQLDLLDAEARRESHLDRTLDQLRQRFGDVAPRRGTTRPALGDRDFRGDDLRRLSRPEDS